MRLVFDLFSVITKRHRKTADDLIYLTYKQPQRCTSATGINAK